jgi:hypothetical protein
MRILVLTSALVLAAAAAMAQPSGPREPAATLCLDPNGGNHSPICRKLDASRFDKPADICHCNGPYRQVEAPYCAKGEKPPSETREYELARAAAASKNSSLFGATYQGQRMCVAMGSNY